MADGRVGKLGVVLEGSDATLSSTLKKGAAGIKDFADSAEKDLKRAAGGGKKNGGFGNAPEEESVFADLAKHVKKLRTEARKSGEGAFAQAIGSGQGMTDTALQALGLGVQASVVDVIGKGFARSTESMKKLASGEVGGKEFMNQFAEGLPLLGEYVAGWNNIFSLIDGSAKAEGELNRKAREGAMVQSSLRGYFAERSARLSATSPDDFTREQGNIEDERNAKNAEIGEQRSTLGEQKADAINKVLYGSDSKFVGFFKYLGGMQMDMQDSIRKKFGMAPDSDYARKFWGIKGNYKIDQNDPRVQEASKPFDTAIALSNDQQKENDARAAALHKRGVEDSLATMEKSIATSRLGSAIDAGGNPAAVLAARQALSRLGTEQALKPIDRELDLNGKAIGAGQGLNGLSLAELKSRNEKLKEQRTAIAAAGEADVTRMAEDEARRRETSLFGIERGIAAGRLDIQRDTARTGEQRLAAQHAAIAEKTRSDLADIDEKLANKSIGGDERAKLTEQRGVVTAAGAAAGQKLDEDEGRRRQSSLIAIEHDIAHNRLSILQSNAHDVAALWTATEAGIKENIQEQLDVVDEKLRQTNLAEAERNKLLEERRGIVAAGAAEEARAKRDFDRDTRRDQQGNAGTLLGVASHLLGNRQSMFGGNNPAAIRMQKQLGIMGDVLGMRQQIDSVLNDDHASAAQKAAARVAQEQLGVWQSSALSSKNLNKTPYQPLRFAEAEEAGQRYEGRAEFQTESDENDYAKSGNMLDEQKETNRLLAAIGEMMKAGGGGASNPLFPK